MGRVCLGRAASGQDPQRGRLPAMRAVVQRVSRASVEVEGATIGTIGHGLLVLVGATHDDTESDVEALARKLIGLRVFRDADDAMNRSVLDVGGEILVVSQFTLYADVRRGRRPSFVAAARPAVAEPLVERVAETLADAGVRVATGRFGAMMDVNLVNDGPVTIIVETSNGSVL